MKPAATITRWAGVTALFLPVLFFFTPYRCLGDVNFSGFDAIKMALGIDKSFGNASGATTAEIILRFMVPVCLMLIAGIIFLIKVNLGTAITATLLSGIAFLFYLAYIGNMINDYYGIEFGLLINFILSITGFILPLAAGILNKIVKSKEKTENASAVTGSTNQEV